MHEESSSRRKVDDDVHDGAVPAYLLDREQTTRAKVCLFFLCLLYSVFLIIAVFHSIRSGVFLRTYVIWFVVWWIHL